MRNWIEHLLFIVLVAVRRKVVIEAAADLHVSAIFSDSLAHKQEAAYQTRPGLILS